MSGGAGAGGTGGHTGGTPGHAANANAPASSPAGGYSPPPIRLKPAYSQPTPVAAPGETAAPTSVKKDPLYDNAAIEAGEKRNLRQQRRPLLANSFANASTLGSSGTIFNRKDYGTTF